VGYIWPRGDYWRYESAHPINDCAVVLMGDAVVWYGPLVGPLRATYGERFK
jgi:hypothetical protein